LSTITQPHYIFVIMAIDAKARLRMLSSSGKCPEMPKIFLVEDQPTAATYIAKGLGEAGMVVDLAADHQRRCPGPGDRTQAHGARRSRSLPDDGGCRHQN
jgi:hypothetical protein